MLRPQLEPILSVFWATDASLALSMRLNAGKTGVVSWCCIYGTAEDEVITCITRDH